MGAGALPMHTSSSRPFSRSRSWKLLAIGVVFQIFTRVQGFAPAPSFSKRKGIAPMAKSRKADEGKIKKKKSFNHKNASKKNSKPNQVKKSGKASSETEALFLPSQKSRAPPWRVLSPKDAKINVKKEQKRRKLAQQGIEMEDSESAIRPSLSNKLFSDVEQKLLKWRRFNPFTVPSGMKLIGSYLDKRVPPRLGVPEIAFLGRSNVGKSSLLNKLSTRAGGDEARVGKTPGATASVNLYAMLGKSKTKARDDKIILGLVDLPGFGYAKLSKEVQAEVQEAAERYLGRRQELALGLLLVDARRVPSDNDCAVLAALYDLDVPIVVVATKVDKLSKNGVDEAMETIRERLGLPPGQPLCVSTVTGEGTKDLWRIIMEACETKADELKSELQQSQGSASEEVTAGNILPQDDDEERYDQGYDWITGSSVMYDYNFKELEGREELDEDDFLPDAPGDSYEERADNEVLKLKDLKRISRRMERRGDL